jgi:16S rRNA (guanine(966)-N(2))-methyltransferase RsmD
MRVVGGEKRGRRLASFRCPSIRPTPDKVREAIFNVLGQDTSALSRVLDLFAGTGAMGIEALSRGSLEATFVDKDPGALKVIKKNLSACALTERARVVKSDALRATVNLKKRGQSFDLVFLDAPYAEISLTNRVLKEIKGLLSPDGIAVVEAAKKSAPEIATVGFELKKEKSYGDTTVYFLGRSERTVKD